MSKLNWEQIIQHSPTAGMYAEKARFSKVNVFSNALARAEQSPDTTAIIENSLSLDYAHIVEQSMNLAASLHELGLRRGDIVSFQLPNWHEAAIINLAACSLGLVCNPIVPIYRETEVQDILSDCSSKALFVPGNWRGYDYGSMASRIKDRLPDLDLVISVRDERAGPASFEEMVKPGSRSPDLNANLASDSVKLIMYTSGTTGRAKGVLHSHNSLSTAVNRAAAHWGLESGDVMLMPSPVTHVTGYCCGLEMPFDLGLKTVLMERWDSSAAYDLINRHSVNAIVGATPFLQELTAEVESRGACLDSLKVFACGGAAVPPDLIRKANKLMAGRAFRIYGSTEAPLITYGSLATDPVDISATTDGRINEYEVQIRSLDVSEAHSSEGEILVRGEGLFLGYADQTQTREAFSEDGFFETGDIGIKGDNDTVVITGRKKDLIIRGGENISAKEIEDILHEHPDIHEVAAVAMPHERMGETVCVYVIMEAGGQLSLQEINAFMKEAGVANQKLPEHLEVVADLPRTASGKVRKDILRKQISQKVVESGLVAV